MAHLYLAATRRSSGKTTLAIGLCRALARQGMCVQPFKKGPDYIDPMWLGQAAGRDCLNLDYYTTPAEEIRDAFATALAGADLGLIEGNLGLFDSVDLEGATSNAALSKLLGAPVVLVVDVQGMTRGVAPLLLGYQQFDPEVRLAGVLFNQVGGARQEANLRRVLAHYTDLPLLGAIHKSETLTILERHLGLMPSNESEESEGHIERIRAVVAEQVDIPALLSVAATASVPAPPSPVVAVPPGEEVRIAIAKDAAFGFYYPDDLAALRRAGARLLPFSPLTDREPPEADGIFIGGGFPECRMQALGENSSMREAIRAFVEAGRPVYAECGGFMYLCRELRWGEARAPMCGVLDAEVVMHDRPQGRGYVRLAETPDFPWPRDEGAPGEIHAHEFHHSAVVRPDPRWVYGWRVLRGTGIDGRHDGVVYRGLVASYSHLRNVGGAHWARRFVDFVRGHRHRAR